eukprot:3938656-Rhodomonas_salina.2
MAILIRLPARLAVNLAAPRSGCLQQLSSAVGRGRPSGFLQPESLGGLGRAQCIARADKPSVLNLWSGG